MRAYSNTPCYYQRAERGTVGKGTCEAAARLEVPCYCFCCFYYYSFTALCVSFLY